MGFFSSLKRIFGAAEAPATPVEPVDAVQQAEQTEAVQQAEASEAVESVEAAEAVSQAEASEVAGASASDTSNTPEASAPPAAPVQAVPATAAVSFPADQLPSATPAPATSAADSARDALTLRLREAEPKLSVWLGIALEGVDVAGDELWQRVDFLLSALGAPPDEAQAFIKDVSGWVARMEYERVADFRSELQYRLALALDMEDEEDERNRLIAKLHDGLAKTRAQLGKSLGVLFAAHGSLTPAFWDELEEVFIMADMGVEVAGKLSSRLKERARETGVTAPDALLPLLSEELNAVFRIPRRVVAVNRPEIVLMIGVNGVGKTTTIAKLAYRARSQGKTVMLAAGDTFRAAAVEQLGIWAERTGSLFHAKGQDADPAAVAWEAVERAVAENVDVLFVDTAGRLHTKTNLMEELKKVRATIAKKHPGAPHRCVLIIDATTGQNALSQVKLFKEAAGIDEIILTKLDGTAKGGVAVAVAMQFGIPITFVGLGEKMEDLRPFDGEQFAAALLAQKD